MESREERQTAKEGAILNVRVVVYVVGDGRLRGERERSEKARCK